LLLLSHRDRYMVVSFSSFLIFLVICVTEQMKENSQSRAVCASLSSRWSSCLCQFATRKSQVKNPPLGLEV
jgi:hypothetical protein